jgi:hypothetical protein
MGLFRQRRAGVDEDELLLEVGVFPKLGEPVPCMVTVVGERGLVPYAPAALLDKLCTNLSHDRDAAAALFLRVVGFIADATKGAHQITDSDGLHRMIARTYSHRVRLIEQAPGDAKARRVITRVYLSLAQQRLGAITKFKGGIASAETAELAFWAVWNFAVQDGESQGVGGSATALSALSELLDLYSQQGIPTIRNGGQAPFIIFAGIEARA